MNNFLRITISLFLSFCYLNCYAIQVHVQTSSKRVSAIGFTVNGKQHGWFGSTYSANDVPAGSYKFGVRADSGDLGCSIDGEEFVNITKDTSVFLNVSGEECSGIVR